MATIEFPFQNTVVVFMSIGYRKFVLCMASKV